MLCPGDHVVVPDDAYGGSYRLVARVAGPWGVEHTAVHLADLDGVRAAIRPGSTRVVWVETPTNPMLAIADITELAHVAHDAGALLVVDNTFATPYLQSPLALGADVVVHSTTKYAGGHSDVIGGALAVAPAPGPRGRRAWATSRATSSSAWPSTRTRWAPCPRRSTPSSRSAA